MQWHRVGGGNAIWQIDPGIHRKKKLDNFQSTERWMKCERISGPIFREREYVRFKPHLAWLLGIVVVAVASNSSMLVLLYYSDARLLLCAILSKANKTRIAKETIIQSIWLLNWKNKTKDWARASIVLNKKSLDGFKPWLWNYNKKTKNEENEY